MKCVICGFSISLKDIIKVKEMMFGTKEEFEYYQCGNCEALQIKDVPKDIFKYYNENYYTEKKGYSQINRLRKFFWRIRSNLSLNGFYPIIKLFSPNSILHWAHLSKINKNSRILDVGCGNGDVLFEFNKHGFKDLFGIDPFLGNIKLPGIELIKTDLLSFSTKSKYDLIMFNHSLEHLYDHHNTIKRAIELLNDNGIIMIRIPLVNKAFEIYKENWVQIDAPRHFVIHSLKSMNLLCEKNGAIVYHYFFDSGAFQFLGSEQYKNGIPANAPNSYKNNLSKSIFTNEDIIKYEAMAREFNKEGLGDSAAFFIRKKSESEI